MAGPGYNEDLLIGQSTPFGITASGTLACNAPFTRSSGAQRLSASRRAGLAVLWDGNGARIRQHGATALGAPDRIILYKSRRILDDFDQPPEFSLISCRQLGGQSSSL